MDCGRGRPRSRLAKGLRKPHIAGCQADAGVLHCGTRKPRRRGRARRDEHKRQRRDRGTTKSLGVPLSHLLTKCDRPRGDSTTRFPRSNELALSDGSDFRKLRQNLRRITLQIRGISLSHFTNRVTEVAGFTACITDKQSPSTVLLTKTQHPLDPQPEPRSQCLRAPETIYLSVGGTYRRFATPHPIA